MQIEYPMLFELTNQSTGQVTHCGVLEFTAEEGNCYIPYWMMQLLFLQEGDFIQVRNVKLPRATYVKLQPHETAFINIANPKAVLEIAFRNFSCLTRGDVICVEYNNRKYDLNVLEVKPNDYNAVSIVETDVQLDFAPPLDYVEPAKPAPPVASSSSSSAAAAAATSAASLGAAAAGSTDSVEAAVKRQRSDASDAAVPFAGTGYTLSAKGAPSRAAASAPPAKKSNKPPRFKTTLVKGELVRVPIEESDSDDDSDDSDDTSSESSAKAAAAPVEPAKQDHFASLAGGHQLRPKKK
jgi:ubiquitin fusion degradation protein 1